MEQAIRILMARLGDGRSEESCSLRARSIQQICCSTTRTYLERDTVNNFPDKARSIKALGYEILQLINTETGRITEEEMIEAR